MMVWKWVPRILAVLIILLIATTYVVLATYDFNQLKSEIIREVKKATGRDLRLEGHLDLALGWTPALVVQNVGFQNAAWGSRAEMAMIKRLEVQVRILPLIRGEIEVKRFVLVEPDLLIESDRSGRSNLQFDRPRDETTAGRGAGVSETGHKILSMLSFRELRVEKGSITCKHGPSGRSYAIRAANLTLRASNSEGAAELSMQGIFRSRTIQASGTLGPLSALLDPEKRWPLKLTVDFAGARFSVDGGIRDALRQRDFDFMVAAQGRSLSEVARIVGAADLPEVGPFNGTADVNDRDGKLAIEKLRLRVGTENLARADISGSFKDPLARQGIEMAFKVQGKNVANLEKLLKRPLPLSGPFMVSGRAFCPGRKKYKFGALKVLLGETRFEGSVETDLSGRRPQFRAALSSQKMDLRGLWAAREPKGTGTVKPAAPGIERKKVFSDALLSVDGLKRADLRITLKAQDVVLPTLMLKKVDLEMTLEKGQLRVKRWKSVMGGGTLDGRLDLAARGDGLSLSVNLEARQVGAEQVLRALKTKGGLEGNVDGDIELSGRGRSVSSIMSGLNGKIVIVSGNGRIKNEYIEVLGSDLASGIFRLIHPFKETTEYTPFNCFVGGFAVDDGVAQITALVMDTDQTTVIGQGKVNLKDESLDIALNPSPKKGLQTGIFGKLSLSFGELAKPLKLGGTLANPSLTLDPTLTALAFGKALGGVILFGPLGIAAALAGRGSGPENPCLAAIEAARKGVKGSEDKPPETKKSPEKKEDPAGNPSEGIRRVFEGIGSSVKKLFCD